MDDTCSVIGCDETFKTHKWGKIKAHDAGWFFQKDGKNFCPAHIPEWVANWRGDEAGRKSEQTRKTYPRQQKFWHMSIAEVQVHHVLTSRPIIFDGDMLTLMKPFGGGVVPAEFLAPRTLNDRSNR